MRDTVLKKWRSLMFVKTHMKDYMRRFRAKKQLRLMLRQREEAKDGETPGMDSVVRPRTAAVEGLRPQERQGTRRRGSTPYDTTPGTSLRRNRLSLLQPQTLATPSYA